jgi:hypothetical protein
MMFRLAWAVLLLAVIVPGAAGHQNETDRQTESQRDRRNTEWIEHVLDSVATIKPGMTRKDLAPVFAVDGGLQVREKGRYVYARCPYIKVDVEFSLAAEQRDFGPDDKIIKVSRPYLEYPTSD